MAQQIKLKRSAVAGKIPSTGSLAAGELAINTVDGKLYFKRDDDTIQSIVTTNAEITGSVNIIGPITGSSLKTGNITADGNLFLSGSNRLVYNNSVSSSLLFGFFDGGNIYGPYYQIFGNSYSDLTQRGSAEFVYDNRNGGGSGFNIASFDGNTWTRKFRVEDTGAQVTGSLGVTGGITGSDIRINQWGSVSASLSSIQSAANSLTLDNVTDNGNTTTNSVTLGGLTVDTNTLYVDTVNKRLGSGTTSPTRNLDLESSTGTSVGIQLNSTAAGGRSYSFFSTNTASSLGGGKFGIYDDTAAAGRIVLDANGNTGFNKNSPTETVDINGNLLVTGSATFTQNLRSLSSVYFPNLTTSTNDSLVTLEQSTGFLAKQAFSAITVGGATSASYAATASSADSFTVRTALTASGLRYPTADGTFEGQLIQTNAAGTLSFGDPTTIYETIYNGEATSLIKGTPVYISGSQGANPIVYRADAADPTKMPVTYIVAEEITTASTGRGIVLGLISGIDLTGYTAGQEVYVAPGGGWTVTRPTGSATVQFLGLVTKPNSGGKGLVLNPGPATLPNLTSGNAWVGDSNSYPVAVPTASFYVTQAASASLAAFATTASYALKAESVGQLNQTVVINGNLQVFGTSSFTYVTSSQLNVDDAFISVNVFEPVERFGGLKVYDSGSSTATASLAWDSLHNHWVYQNASGSTYTGGMFLAGPRNTGSLGDEPNLTKWFVPRSDGGDHLDNSQIFSSGSTTIITGSLTTTGKVTVNTVDNYGSDPDKFLAIVNGEIVYRTGAQVLSDIGGQTAGTFVQNAGGGGQARYIMRYEDSNSATTSSIYEDTSGRIGIKTTTPRTGLEISGSNAIINDHAFGRGSSNNLSTIAIGSGSLSTTNTVSAGVFIGTGAGSNHTSGTNSVVIGNLAAWSGSRARESVIIGEQAAAYSKPGDIFSLYQDVYIGRYSGYSHNGYWNVGIGYRTLENQNQISNTQAAGNTAIGTFSMVGNDFQGYGNSAVGIDSLAEIQSGSYNVAMGERALVALMNASNNVGIGSQALQRFDDNEITGTFQTYTQNTAVGHQVGYNLRSGSFNTFLGAYAAFEYWTGSHNVVIGTDYADDLNNTEGNLVITAGSKRILHSRDGVTTLSGSLALKGTTTVVQQGILVSGTTSLAVASINTGSYEGAFLDYVITSGSNKRAGTLTTVWSASDIEWNDASTLDLGSTAGAEFAPTLAGSNANIALNLPAGTWTLKGHLRYM